MKEDKIRIDPCSENWDAMTPTEQGRNCSKCVKTVHDVCNTTEENIWKKYAENDGNMCIRIQADRVTNPTPQLPWYIRLRYTAAAAILTLLLSIQHKLSLAQSDNVDKKVDDYVKTIDSMKITGVVLDSLLEESKIAFATVILFKNDKKIGGAFTNSEGRFELTASEAVSDTDSIRLEVSQVGFSTFSKKITALKDSLDCEIYCKEEHICLKEVTIAVDRRSLKEDTRVIMGAMPFGRRMTGVMISNGSRKILDDYDTKTFYSDEIERFNLGR